MFGYGTNINKLIFYFYENRQGYILDEQSNDAMKWAKEIDPFYLKTFTTLRKYQDAQPSEQKEIRGSLDETINEVSVRAKEEDSKPKGKAYKVYSPDQKVLFLYYLRVKLYKAAKAARLSGVAVVFFIENKRECEANLHENWDCGNKCIDIKKNYMINDGYYRLGEMLRVSYAGGNDADKMFRSMVLR